MGFPFQIGRDKVPHLPLSKEMSQHLHHKLLEPQNTSENFVKLSYLNSRKQSSSIILT